MEAIAIANRRTRRMLRLPKLSVDAIDLYAAKRTSTTASVIGGRWYELLISSIAVAD